MRVYLIIFIMVFIVLSGVLTGLSIDQEFKKPIQPKIRIEAINGKSDTTYIYEF